MLTLYPEHRPLRLMRSPRTVEYPHSRLCSGAHEPATILMGDNRRT